MCDCQKCHTAHQNIRTELKELHNLLEFHQAEVHGTLVEREEIRHWDVQTEGKVDKLADAIMGPQLIDYDGEWHRAANEGLVAKVDANSIKLDEHGRTLSDHGEILTSIDRQVHNGLKVNLDAKAWAAIVTTLISTLGLIVIALLG